MVMIQDDDDPDDTVTYLNAEGDDDDMFASFAEAKQTIKGGRWQSTKKQTLEQTGSGSPGKEKDQKKQKQDGQEQNKAGEGTTTDPLGGGEGGLGGSPVWFVWVDH